MQSTIIGTQLHHVATKTLPDIQRCISALERATKHNARLLQNADLKCILDDLSQRLECIIQEVSDLTSAVSDACHENCIAQLHRHARNTAIINSVSAKVVTPIWLLDFLMNCNYMQQERTHD